MHRKANSTLWAITSYFNPASYQRRLENYRLFRKRLNVPLIAVEQSFDGRFALEENRDAEILLQLHGGDVLWQKERMMNIALRSLPQECRAVVCIDCDLFFEHQDWSAEVAKKLERVPLMQPYRRVHHLKYGQQSLAENIPHDIQPSLAARVAEGYVPRECIGWARNGREIPCAPGGAVAFRRELIEKHGLYDACILGSGDLALMAAAYGCFDEAPTFLQMSDAHRAHYLRWAQPFHRHVNGAVGAAKFDVCHLWHGNLRNRGYRQRHLSMQQFDFDPDADVALNSAGLWKWNSNKPGLHKFVCDYFLSRREDDAPEQSFERHAIRTDDLSSFGDARFRSL